MSSSLAAKARKLDIARARRDPAFFVHLARGYHRDPVTGRDKAVEILPMHRDWHGLCSAIDRLVILAAIETGKTEQLSIGRVVWELGTNPAHTIAIISGSGPMAEKIGGAIRREIESNPVVREVFPDLKPSTGRTQKWTDKAFRVKNAPPGQKDPSVQCIGVGGPVLGSRLSLVVLDDVLTKENTLTAYRRQAIKEWFFSTITGRLLAIGRVWALGNAWYGDDLLHELGERRGYAMHRFEVYREVDGAGHPDPTSLAWPQKWSLDRIRRFIRENLLHEARRQLRSLKYSAGIGKWQEEWFDRAFHAGEGKTFLDRWVGSWPTFCGVDLGASEREGSDETCFFVIAHDPETNTKLPIFVETTRLTAPEIVKRMKELHRRYGCLFIVENVAAQVYLEQFVREAGLLVKGFTTGKSKADPRYGVPSLATELEQGQWILPSEEAELVAWKLECMNYSPGAHAGDRLMASWFAREGSRLSQVVLQGDADATPDPAPGMRADYTRPLRGRYTPQSARPSRPGGAFGRGRGRLRLVS